ncbi:response regulator [Mucilaginibacter flavus]|uniref:response regulator n=1 Tax=Mucilaginibacter flavus TaxID=931504 RepID=UPI0025B33FC8|nr:response regulator [Mucilaginibacter flavus]MDN3582893.1 response regulator [Mucilaginibacter flavus]
MYKFNLACIVDDDSIVRLTSEVMIFNYKIAKKTITFEHGKAALDYFKQFKNQPEMLPELILLDINMPVMNGWGFIQRFAKLQPTLSRKVVIYLVSSSIDPADHSRATELELISGFVIKPVSKKALEEMVRVNIDSMDDITMKN